MSDPNENEVRQKPGEKAQHLSDREKRKGWIIEEVSGVKMKVLTREKFLVALQKP